MRWNHPQITLVPRSISNCIDFAILFFGKHLLLYLKLWAMIAFPSCLLIYFLAYNFESGGWTAILIFFVASAPLGVLVTLATTPVLIGDQCTMRGLSKQLEEVGPLILMRAVLLRFVTAAGAMLFFFPGVWVALRYRFFVEKESLQGMKERLHDANADQLIKEEWSNSLGHAISIFLFCSLLSVSLFFTIDTIAGNIFMFPIFMGRLPELYGIYGFDNYFESLIYFAWHDPWVLMLALATALLVYPIGRLAWLFCYVDCRVRYDCWDIELKFNDEVRYLENKK